MGLLWQASDILGGPAWIRTRQTVEMSGEVPPENTENVDEESGVQVRLFTFGCRVALV